MSKKNVIVILVVVAVLVLSVGIYLLFFTMPSTQTGGVSNNSPFGNYNGSSSTTPQLTVTTPTPADNNDVSDYVNTPTSPLTKISTAPIAGAETFDRKISKATTTSIVRYIERATGHTREYDASKFSLNTSSNTTIPSIYRAWWSGNTVLAQFLDQNKNIKTFTGTLPASTTPTTQLTGKFLTDNVYTLAISPKGTRVFTIPAGESAVGSISNLDGTKKTSILSFPFNEWNVQWPNESTITLTTRPTFGTSGYMYFLTTGGTMTKALGNIAGLTTLTSPDLANAIFSSSNTGGFATGIYNFSKGTTLAFTSNPTLPEKCVWSKTVKTTAYCAVPVTIPVANYPDDWYKGNISFVDNIYKIDLKLSAVQLVYSLPKDQNIDAFNLFLDTKEENLYFTNKNDYYLWGLKVKGL